MTSKKAARAPKKRRPERDITSEIIVLPAPPEMVIRPFKWTEKQEALISCVLNPKTNIIFVNATAGVGKTLVSLYCALVSLKEKTVNKILYVRSPVEACDAKIGFLPSTLDEKMKPYSQPAEDALLSMISKFDLEKMKNDGALSTLPVGFARGLSFHNTFVVIDESGDLDTRNLELLCERFGKKCKMMIIGCHRQSQIKEQGFTKVFDAFNTEQAKEKGIYCFTFEKSDSLRSPIAEFIANTMESIT